MFDPLQYIAHIERALTIWQERGAEITWPKYTLNFDRYKQWDVFYWNCKVIFPSGHRFNASESHLRERKEIHLRKISYRLMQQGGQLIYQIDTHTMLIPYDECPHMHIGPSEDDWFEEGDPRLEGVSLQDFDFQSICIWVDKYINEDGKMPWQN